MTVDEVTGNLWVGSAPMSDDDVSDYTDVLVLCAEEYQPPDEEFGPVEVLRAPIEDNFLTDEFRATVEQVSNQVAHALHEGKRVWVTCMAGFNRSALVAGMALRKLGWEPEQTIDAIRDARGPWSLSNPDFEEALRGSVGRIVFVDD